MDLNQRLMVKLDSLKNSPFLQLSDFSLGDDGCRILADFLRSHGHDQLTRIDLKANNIGERGVTYLAQVLQENDSIKKLALEWNNIGISDQAVQILCQALYHNTSL